MEAAPRVTPSLTLNPKQVKIHKKINEKIARVESEIHMKNMQMDKKRRDQKRILWERRLRYLKTVINEMDLILIRKLGVSRQELQETKVWPSQKFEHHLSREFFLAVKRNDIRVVKEMLDYKSKFLVFQFDELKRTALIMAVRQGFKEMALCLLEHHSRVDWQDISEKTALHFAVEDGNLALTKILLLY